MGFDLHGGVADAEVAADMGIGELQHQLAVGPFIDQQMAAERMDSRSDRPDPQIMHIEDAVDLFQLFPHLARTDVRRRAFHQDVNRLPDYFPGPFQDQAGDQDADQRIGHNPVPKIHQQAGDNRADRPQRVAENVQIGAAHVDVGFYVALAQQCPSAQKVGEQADHRDSHHRNAAHGFRRPKAMNRFKENQAGNDKQSDSIEQSGQDFHPGIAVMLVGGGRLGGEPHRQQTEDQRAYIAQHVPGIRQQRQTVRGQPAEELQQ